jgi:SAM-dependent methyltransferase
MPYECGKAALRRLHEPGFCSRYFVGDGIDIGGGYDPLWNYHELFPAMTSCRNWDLDDGDAQEMAGVADESFDFVHSSHCLEHMPDPAVALGNWFRICRPGGHLIVLVPDEDLYEQGEWPSTWNPDHRHSFTIHKGTSWSPESRNVTALIAALGDCAYPVKIALLDLSYRYALAAEQRVDQTGAITGECAIEFIVRKLYRPHYFPER